MTFRTLLLGVGFGCFLAGAGAESARAETAPDTETPAAMAVTGECPSAGAIWSDVKAIVPSHDLGRVTSARIEVSDLGATYHVRIVSDDGERQRTFRDPEHDCDHRARFAAVFIVVTLLPPDVLLEAPPAVAPTPSAPPPAVLPPVIVVVPPAPAMPPRKRLRIEASALFDAAPAVAGADAAATTLGGELRLFLRPGRLAAMAGLGFEPRASFTFGNIVVDELRIPFDLGAAFVHAWSHLALVGQAGMAAAMVRISGNNTASPGSGTRLDLGGRIAVSVRFGSSSSTVVPVAGIHALVFPKPYEATATPEGNIGQLPAFWVGLTAGVSFAP
jgi:hypothetical protein